MAFDKETSVQLLVWIAPHVPEGTTPEELGADAIRAWGVGQAAKDNGVVLFVFTKDRKTRIATGYGMEGVIPDAIAKRILADVMRPHLSKGDFEVGVQRGVEALLAASRGERLSATTAPPAVRESGEDPGLPWHLAVAAVVALVLSRLRGGGLPELFLVGLLGVFLFFFGAGAPPVVSWVLVVFFALAVIPVLVIGRVRRSGASGDGSSWSSGDSSWSSSDSGSGSSDFSGGGGDSGGGGASDDF